MTAKDESVDPSSNEIPLTMLEDPDVVKEAKDEKVPEVTTELPDVLMVASEARRGKVMVPLLTVEGLEGFDHDTETLRATKGLNRRPCDAAAGSVVLADGVTETRKLLEGLEEVGAVRLLPKILRVCIGTELRVERVRVWVSGMEKKVGELEGT